MLAITQLCDRFFASLRRLDWTGPLTVRVVLGLVFVASGWGKLHALDDVTGYFASLGIPAPGVNAAFVSTVELVGGAALLLGLAARVAALLLSGVMVVAIATAILPGVHGVVELAGTVEVVYLAALVWLAVAGAGRASIDHLWARSRPRAGRDSMSLASTGTVTPPARS